MAIACVVLDFDGTFTDVVAEGAPFLTHFQQALFQVLGRDATQAWTEEVASLHDGVDRYGWEVAGRIVAPATADPYLTATCTAHRLLQRFGRSDNEAARTEVVQALYRDAYRHSATAFKEEAKEVLEALLATGLSVNVVTNAHTELVEAKLTQLAPKGRERLKVFGDARKFVLEEPEVKDPRFDALPEALKLEGVLGRPVYLRRGRYFSALKRIWDAAHTGPEATLVAGDIFELDLAMPAALGAHVQLVERANVMPYERAAVQRLGSRGSADKSLRAILPRLR